MQKYNSLTNKTNILIEKRFKIRLIHVFSTKIDENRTFFDQISAFSTQTFTYFKKKP